mgnify:CR=1 FL=1
MIIKSLKLSFAGKSGGASVFKTENGAEVTIDDFLLKNFDGNAEPLYLAMDNFPLVSSQDNQKDILNELMNPDGSK